MRGFWPVSNRLGNVVATPPTYLWLSMEPTGIEPVTSCLQSDTTDPLYGPIFRRVCRDCGPGGTRDTAGLGSISLDLGSGIGLLPKRSPLARDRMALSEGCGGSSASGH
jgi:hypothetical protein